MWTKAALKAFELIKGKSCLTPTVALPNFELLFEVTCDASKIGIHAVLALAESPLAYFSEK